MADLRIVDAPVILQESITDDVKMPTGGLGNFSIRLGDIVWYVVTKEQLANKNYVDLSSKGVKDKLDSHVADKANPHQVTKAQVGLGNVDNTADVDKPVSNATKSAIITATTDMATKAYVNSKDGDLSTLTTTDKTSLVKAINEVVSVKANKDDVASSISSLTNNKADKATTLEGYGIIDAYTKSEIDTTYNGIKTLYDKNVEAGAGANGWAATLVKDASGLSQQQVNDQLGTGFYAEKWGAKGDGVTFDTAAIQAGIDALSAKFKADGKPRSLLFRSDGVYVCRNLELKPGVNLICPNGVAKLLRTPAEATTTEADAKWWRIIQTITWTWNTDADFDYRVTLKNLVLDGNYRNTNWTFNTYNQEQASCLALSGVNSLTDITKRRKFHLENVTFMNSPSDGLHVVNDVDLTFKNLNAIRCFRGGLVVTGGNSIVYGDGMVSQDARLDTEIDSPGINNSTKSYLYLTNYYQDVNFPDSKRNFEGGCDIGGMGGGVLHFDNVNVHSYPLNVFFAANANEKFEKLLIDNSVFHTSGQNWFNPTNGEIRNTKFVLRNDVNANVHIPILANYYGYKQDTPTDFTFNKCKFVLQDLTKETIQKGVINVESHAQANLLRICFIDCDLSQTNHADTFGAPIGCNLLVDNCKVNSKNFLYMGGVLDGYAARAAIGYVEFGANVTKFMHPDILTSNANNNSLTFLQNCRLPQRVNTVSMSNGQSGVPRDELKSGNRTILGTTPPLATTHAWANDVYVIDGARKAGMPYEWVAVNNNFGSNAQWVATKWLTGSFATADLPVLTAFDVGVTNFDTTTNTFKRWSGTAWI